MAVNLGWQTKLGIGTTSPVTTRLNYISSTFTKTRQIILPQGGDGNLDPLNSRARLGISTIQGSIRLEPTAAELAVLLPWVFGATNSGTSFPLGSTFVGYYVSNDLVQKVLDWSGVKVARGVLEALPNQPITLSLDLIGLTETVSNAGTFPSLSADASTAYFVLTDGVFSVNSVTTCSELFRVTWDNVATYAPFTNCSTGPQDVIATERIITVEFLPAYDSDHGGLYPPAEAGWAVSATFTNGAVSMALSWPKVVFNHQSPSAPGGMRDIVRLPLTGRAWRTSTDPAQACVLDSVP